MFVTGGSRKITGREMRFKKVERAWIRSSTPRRDTFSFVSGLRSIIYFLRKLFHARIFFFLYSLLFHPSIYDSNRATTLLNREILATAKAREMCGQDVCVCVRYFLFHLAIVNADWSNLMFFSSLPEKRESFSRFSPPPPDYLPFASIQSRQSDSTLFLSLIHLFIYFLRILGLESLFSSTQILPIRISFRSHADSTVIDPL